MSEEDKNKRQEKLTGNCNTFYVEGIRCQGYTEKRYFQFLVATNSVLSKSKRLGIKTPFGYCFPDFDFEISMLK